MIKHWHNENMIKHTNLVVCCLLNLFSTPFTLIG